VLRLLGQSCTNAEIADRLVVSTRTVDSHVAAVLAKLGVTTRRAGAPGPGTWASSTRKYRSRERRLR
jgi:Bacterial regulatory proteins, luxR family